MTHSGQPDHGGRDREAAALQHALRERFARHADPVRAAEMQAYMKSALPFWGIPAPQRRRLMADAVNERPCRDTTALAAAMRLIWREATHREEWYAAMELARVGPHRRLPADGLLPAYRQMIVDSAWWDCCDDISGHALAGLLQRDPATMKPTLRRWARGNDLWLRRAAMLAQRRLRSGFDAALLYDCLEPSLDDPRFAGEFFIRKGMGWALRERSYAAPAEVADWCRRHADRLSPLTKREALKALKRRAAGVDPDDCDGAGG